MFNLIIIVKYINYCGVLGFNNPFEPFETTMLVLLIIIFLIKNQKECTKLYNLFNCYLSIKIAMFMCSNVHWMHLILNYKPYEDFESCKIPFMGM